MFLYLGSGKEVFYVIITTFHLVNFFLVCCGFSSGLEFSVLLFVFSFLLLLFNFSPMVVGLGGGFSQQVVLEIKAHSFLNFLECSVVVALPELPKRILGKDCETVNSVNCSLFVDLL